MTIEKLNKYIPWMNGLSAVLMAITLYMIFFFAPIERLMGNVQRIFYFHVGAYWAGFITLFVALIAGVMYLRNRKTIWDTVSVASVEIGLVFLTIGTIGGSVWGKPAWNTYWEWTPRLTLVTVMWLTYVAYLMLRGAIEDRERRARFAAVYVIVAFITALMAYLSIRFLRDIHPVIFGGTVVDQAQSQGLQEFGNGLDSARMGMTLTMATSTFTVLYIAWLFMRMRLQLLLDESAVLKQRVIAKLQTS